MKSVSLSSLALFLGLYYCVFAWEDGGLHLSGGDSFYPELATCATLLNPCELSSYSQHVPKRHVILGDRILAYHGHQASDQG